MVGSYLFYSCTSSEELVSQQIFKAQIEGVTYSLCPVPRHWSWTNPTKTLLITLSFLTWQYKKKVTAKRSCQLTHASILYNLAYLNPTQHTEQYLYIYFYSYVYQMGQNGLHASDQKRSKPLITIFYCIPESFKYKLLFRHNIN